MHLTDKGWGLRSVVTELAAVAACVARELALFAALGFAVGGISDLAIDLIWIVRGLWRRGTVYRRFARATVATLAPGAPGRIAVFVPAWDEGAVIGAMLSHLLAAWPRDVDWVVYVGVYPNDPATITAVTAIADPRLIVAPTARSGPTTKADCLNALWHRLLADEAAGIMYHLHQRLTTKPRLAMA